MDRQLAQSSRQSCAFALPHSIQDALAHYDAQDATQKKERQDMDDEQRERKHIEEQIERARIEAQAKASTSTAPISTEPLPEAPSGPIKIGLSLKKPPSPDENTESKPFALALKPNPLKANPLKASNALKPNPLKAPRPVMASQPLSAVEAIAKEEMERKRRREAMADQQEKRPRYEVAA